MALLAVVGGACANGDDAGPTSTSLVPPTTAAVSTTVVPTSSSASTSISVSTTVAASTTAVASTLPATTSSSVPAAQPTVLVYFLRNELLTVAGRTVDDASPEAALNALLAGPTAAEAAAGAVSVVPAGTRLLGVDVDDGEALVDLSGVFAEGGGSLSLIARVTQVVFTVTQFPGVETVRFRIDGEAVVELGGEGLYVDGLTRDTYDWLVPFVLLERPVAGSPVSRPLRLSGRVGGAGQELVIEVRDAFGELVYGTVVPSPGGGGTWGVLDVTLTDLPSALTGVHTIRVLDPASDPTDERSRPAEVVVTL